MASIVRSSWLLWSPQAADAGAFDPSSMVRYRWCDGGDDVAVQVDYGPTVALGSHVHSTSVDVSGEGAWASLGANFVHTALIVGLTADTEYYVQIAGDTTVRRFRTAPAAGVPLDKPLLIEPDLHTSAAGTVNYIRNNTTRELMANEGLAMVLLGDLAITPDNDSTQMYAILLAFSSGTVGQLKTPLGYSVPLVTTIGNHDKEVSGTRWYTVLFSDLNYYSIQIGDVLGIFIPDGAILTGSDATMLAWMKTTLIAARASATVKHTFAFAHGGGIPSYFSWTSNTQPRQYWYPIFERYGLDSVFVGHQHQFQRSKPIADANSAMTEDAAQATSAVWGFREHTTGVAGTAALTGDYAAAWRETLDDVSDPTRSGGAILTTDTANRTYTVRFRPSMAEGEIVDIDSSTNKSRNTGYLRLKAGTGLASFVQTPAADRLNLASTDPLTIRGVLRWAVETTEAQQVIVTKRTPGAGTDYCDYQLSIDVYGRLCFSFRNADGSLENEVHTTSTMANGTDYLYAVCFTPGDTYAAAKVDLFFGPASDGANIAKQPMAYTEGFTPWRLTNSTNPIRIGALARTAFNAGTGFFFNGWLGPVNISKSAAYSVDFECPSTWEEIKQQWIYDGNCLLHWNWTTMGTDGTTVTEADAVAGAVATFKSGTGATPSDIAYASLPRGFGRFFEGNPAYGNLCTTDAPITLNATQLRASATLFAVAAGTYKFRYRVHDTETWTNGSSHAVAMGYSAVTEDFTLAFATYDVECVLTVAAATVNGGVVEFVFPSLSQTWGISDFAAGAKGDQCYIHNGQIGVGHFDDFDAATIGLWSDSSARWVLDGDAHGSIGITGSDGAAGTGHLTATAPPESGHSNYNATFAKFVLPPGITTLGTAYTVRFGNARPSPTGAGEYGAAHNRTLYMYVDTTHAAGRAVSASTNVGLGKSQWIANKASATPASVTGLVSTPVMTGWPNSAETIVAGPLISNHTECGRDGHTPSTCTDTTDIPGAGNITIAVGAALDTGMAAAGLMTVDAVWLRGGFGDGEFVSGWKDQGWQANWTGAIVACAMMGDQSATLTVETSNNGSTVATTCMVALANGVNTVALTGLVGQYVRWSVALDCGTTSDTPTVSGVELVGDSVELDPTLPTVLAVEWPPSKAFLALRVADSAGVQVTAKPTRGAGSTPTAKFDGGAAVDLGEPIAIQGPCILFAVPAGNQSAAAVTITFPVNCFTTAEGSNAVVTDHAVTTDYQSLGKTLGAMPSSRIPLSYNESICNGTYYASEIIHNNLMFDFGTWYNNDGTEYDRSLLDANGIPTALQSGKSTVTTLLLRTWTAAGVTKSPGGAATLRWKEKAGGDGSSSITVAYEVTGVSEISGPDANGWYSRTLTITADASNGVEVRISNVGSTGIAYPIEVFFNAAPTTTYLNPTFVARRLALHAKSARPMDQFKMANGMSAESELTPYSYQCGGGMGIGGMETFPIATSTSAGITIVADDTDPYFVTCLAADGYTVVEITLDAAHPFHTGDCVKLVTGAWTIGGTSLNVQFAYCCYNVSSTKIRMAVYARGALVDTGVATVRATRWGGWNARRAAEYVNACGIEIFYWNCPVVISDAAAVAWAQEFFTYVAAGKKLKLAYGNEVWNWGWPYHEAMTYCTMMAIDNIASLGGVANVNRWIAYRTEQLRTALIAGVTELAADPTRLRIVYEEQRASLTRLQAMVTWAVAQDYTFEEVSIASYLTVSHDDAGISDANQIALGAEGIIDLEIYRSCALQFPTWATFGAWAAAIAPSGDVVTTGRYASSYEGGPYALASTGDTDLLAVYYAAFAHARMREVYRHHYHRLQDAGFDEVMQYPLTGRWTPGSIGHTLPYYDSTAEDSPGYAGMLDWAVGPVTMWGLGGGIGWGIGWAAASGLAFD
jgi:hypothetical protein